MNAPIEWLLAGEPWVAYRTRRDLLGQAEADPAVQAARAALLADPAVQRLVAELGEWPGTVIASHKSAGQPFHKLTFLADLGLTVRDPGVARIADRILAHQAAEGPFQLPMTVSGATGAAEEKWAWALCDAPLLVYALEKFGLGDEAAVQAARAHLLGLVRENGWPCAVAPQLGNWRGPGRKGDPCPFATLAMLKALGAAAPQGGAPEAAARRGTEALLGLWADSAVQHPYMFFMGTDFRKLKVPFVWYDLLHVLEVLTVFPWLQGAAGQAEARLAEMLALLQAKADEAGRYTPESVWTAWQGWEFGQKRAPSRWLTLLAWRILGRAAAS